MGDLALRGGVAGGSAAAFVGAGLVAAARWLQNAGFTTPALHLCLVPAHSCPEQFPCPDCLCQAPAEVRCAVAAPEVVRPVAEEVRVDSSAAETDLAPYIVLLVSNVGTFLAAWCARRGEQFRERLPRRRSRDLPGVSSPAASGLDRSDSPGALPGNSVVIRRGKRFG